MSTLPVARRTAYRPGEDHWRRFAMRGVKTAGAAGVIALCLWAAYPRRFGVTLVYSTCISLSCWLIIDLGRDAVSRCTGWSLFGEPAAGTRWTGWALRLGVIVVGALSGYAIGNGIANALTGLGLPGPFDADLRQALPLIVLATVPAVVITYFFQSREVIAQHRAEVERVQRQAAEQRLKLLESQLEPHMLFNTLANLRVLIAVDPQQAQAMLDHLIAFLRTSLAGSRARDHSLAAEFDRLRDYLALMQVRMGPRLAIRFDLPSDLASMRVPPLLLQPLVENSIKHGLEPKREGGRIEVEAAREGAHLVLRVRETGIGPGREPPGGAGFGLAAVRERLDTSYGDGAARFTLEAAGDDAGGTLATVRLPLAAAGARDRRAA